MFTGPINPLAPAIAATPAAMEQSQADRAERLRRRERVSRSGSMPEDQFVDRPVEDADTVEAIGDAPERRNSRHSKKRGDDEETTGTQIDLTA